VNRKSTIRYGGPSLGTFGLKLKIDENLPADCAVLLRNSGFEADTVADKRLAGADDNVIASRSQAEERDLDRSNVRAYPLAQHAGIIFLRARRQDQRTVLALIDRIVLALTNRTPARTLDRRTGSNSIPRRIADGKVVCPLSPLFPAKMSSLSST
jgi:predicted nuclease of predicted toxin-antitoxin system